MQQLNIKNFRAGVAISILIAVALLIISFYAGKKEFFLLLNADLGKGADYFFGIFTNAGDSLMWVAVLLIIFFVIKRKDTWVLLVSAFAMVTIFTQVCKYLIVPDEPRPWSAITDHSIIHHVWFVEPWLISSFPSGHTATAFTFYLIFCLLLTKNRCLIIGLVYAMLVGYSRIYLAQHFPLDVAAGIIVAVVSVIIALSIQQYYWKIKKP